MTARYFVDVCQYYKPALEAFAANKTPTELMILTSFVAACMEANRPGVLGVFQDGFNRFIGAYRGWIDDYIKEHGAPGPEQLLMIVPMTPDWNGQRPEPNLYFGEPESKLIV